MPAEGGPGTMQVTGQKEAQRREDNGSGHKPPETWASWLPEGPERRQASPRPFLTTLTRVCHSRWGWRPPGPDTQQTALPARGIPVGASHGSHF